MTYFASILFKRAYDRNETMFCRFLTKKHFGKCFEKFWNSTKNSKKSQIFKTFFFSKIAHVPGVPHVHTSGTQISAPQKKLIQHHSFPTSHLAFYNSSRLFLCVICRFGLKSAVLGGKKRLLPLILFLMCVNSCA